MKSGLLDPDKSRLRRVYLTQVGLGKEGFTGAK